MDFMSSVFKFAPFCCLVLNNEATLVENPISGLDKPATDDTPKRDIGKDLGRTPAQRNALKQQANAPPFPASGR